MSDSELVVNKNKAHRKDKREHKAIIHIPQIFNCILKHGIRMISTSKFANSFLEYILTNSMPV